jgi:hypothetical protein
MVTTTPITQAAPPNRAGASTAGSRAQETSDAAHLLEQVHRERGGPHVQRRYNLDKFPNFSQAMQNMLSGLHVDAARHALCAHDTELLRSWLQRRKFV